MSMALVSISEVIFMLGASAASLSICSKGDDEDDEETQVSGEQVEGPKSGPRSGETPSSTSPSGESPSGEAVGKSVEFSAEHPDVKFVLQFQGDPTEEFIKRAQGVAQSASMFLWGAHKRALANAAAWKDLAKRITMLQAEGFDTLAGSNEAKERRKIVMSQKATKPRLLDTIEETGKKKKKHRCFAYHYNSSEIGVLETVGSLAIKQKGYFVSCEMATLRTFFSQVASIYRFGIDNHVPHDEQNGGVGGENGRLRNGLPRRHNAES